MSYPCSCCGYLTFDEKPQGTFEICPVCFWEDDETQNQDPNYAGGANEVSLNEARGNFGKFGAISRKYVKKVRKPLPEENPSQII